MKTGDYVIKDNKAYVVTLDNQLRPIMVSEEGLVKRLDLPTIENDGVGRIACMLEVKALGDSHGGALNDKPRKVGRPKKDVVVDD